jgi:hypothetical protein
MGTRDASTRVASVGVVATLWVGTIAASLVVFQVVAAATGHNGQSTTQMPFWLYPMASMVSLWVPTALGLWWVSKRFLSAHMAADFGWRFRPVDLVGIPIGVACQTVLLWVLYWPLGRVWPATFSRHRLEVPGHQLTDRASGVWKVALVLAVAVAAPLVEETLYRGLLTRSLQARFGGWLAVVISSVWFAAAHLQPVQFIGLAAFGLVVGTCYQRTGRIAMGVLAHGAFNATSLWLLWAHR